MQDLAQDSTATAPAVHYAGFWIRCSATILDTILQAIVVTPVLLYVFGLEALLDANTDLGNTDLYLSAGLMLVVVQAG